MLAKESRNATLPYINMQAHLKEYMLNYIQLLAQLYNHKDLCQHSTFNLTIAEIEENIITTRLTAHIEGIDKANTENLVYIKAKDKDQLEDIRAEVYFAIEDIKKEGTNNINQRNAIYATKQAAS